MARGAVKGWSLCPRGGQSDRSALVMVTGGGGQGGRSYERRTNSQEERRSEGLTVPARRARSTQDESREKSVIRSKELNGCGNSAVRAEPDNDPGEGRGKEA